MKAILRNSFREAEPRLAQRDEKWHLCHFQSPLGSWLYTNNLCPVFLAAGSGVEEGKFVWISGAFSGCKISPEKHKNSFFQKWRARPGKRTRPRNRPTGPGDSIYTIPAVPWSLGLFIPGMRACNWARARGRINAHCRARFL